MTERKTTAERLAAYQRDFPQFAAEVLKIQNKAGRIQAFTLNRAQRRLWQLIEERRVAGKPVRLYILKARQLGFSTLTQGLAYWRTTLWPNANALVVSHALDSAEALFEKSKVFYSQAPREFRPARKLSNRREMHFANPKPDGPPGLESRIMVQTAENKHLGASFTLHFVHLSEFARYEEIQQNVRLAMATLLQSVPDLPETWVILETTAQGYGYAKDVWDTENDFAKVFVSWVADETYTSDTPVDPADLSDVEDSEFGNEAHALKYVLAELEFWYPELKDDPAELMQEALRRMTWRRQKIATGFGGDINLFRQEYPLYAEEAFITSGASVFDGRKVHDVKQALYERNEDGKLGPLVQPAARYRFDRDLGRFYRADHGPLRVYEPPQKGVMYVIGADVAEGIKQGDYSAAQVLRVPDLKQVAVYRDQLDPDDFGRALYTLGMLYGWAYLVVETNGPGFATNLTLTKNLYYPNLYRREVFDKQLKTYTDKTGWQTNKTTKNVLVTDYRAVFAADLLRFHDPDTLDEMGYFVQHDDGTIGAVAGENDDLVIAMGLALQGAASRGLLRVRAAVERPEAPDYRGPGSFEWWAALAKHGEYDVRRHGALSVSG